MAAHFNLRFLQICLAVSVILSLINLTRDANAQGRLETIVQTGWAAVDENGVVGYAGRGALNDNGEFVFRVNLDATSGGFADYQAIWLYSDGGLTQIMRMGNPAPDNGNYGSFSFSSLPPGFNNSGQVTFHTRNMTGTAGGTTDDTGLFFYDGSAVQEIMREGGSAPVSGVFHSPSSSPPQLNDFGQAVFSSSFTDTSLRSGLFLYDSGTTNELLRTGQSANGNGVFNNFTVQGFNDAGQVAFKSGLSGTTGGNTDNLGLFLLDSGNVIEVMRKGDSAGSNGSFAGSQHVQLNESGQVAFSSSLSGTSGGFADDLGIYFYDGNNVIEIGREGSAAPSNGNFGFNTNELQINDSGHVAFNSMGMSGTSAGSADDSGLFLYDGISTTEVAREGDAAPSNGNFGTFYGLQLNNAGQLAFFSTDMTGTSGGTTDNSGVFITDGIEMIEVRRTGEVLDGQSISFLALYRESINEFGQLAVYSGWASNEGAYELWTPELHWRSNSGGNWSENANWTLSLNPGHVHDTFIDPATDLTVQGPASNAQVRDFHLGGGAGSPILNWNSSSSLTARNISVHNGTLTGGGTFNADSLVVETAGSIINNGNTMEFNTPSVLNSGLVETRDGFTTVNGNIANTGVGNIEVYGEAALLVNGDLENQGTLFIEEFAFATVSGEYRGVGEFVGAGILNIDGTLSPGNSVASILMDGIVNLDAAATSLFELGGDEVGQFDQIYGMDEFNVDGELLVSLTNGFELSGNQEFLIADVQGILSGQFSGLDEGGLVGQFGDARLYISYTAGDGNDIALYSATPEPGTGLVGGLLIVASLLTRRRKHRA